MRTFVDDTTEEVFKTRFAPGISQSVSVAAHEALRLITAATSLADVSVLGPILRWKSLPGKYGVQVDQKWCITFNWNDATGATALHLERRK